MCEFNYVLLLLVELEGVTEEVMILAGERTSHRKLRVEGAWAE